MPEMPRGTEDSQIEAVLFDFDGTLVDASEVICRSFRAALDDRLAREVDDGRIRKMIGQPLRAMFGSVDPSATEAQVDTYVRRYRRVFEGLAPRLARPLPGVLETIPALADRLSLGIVTTRTAEGAIRMLETHGLRAYFTVVIGLEQVERPKPDPQPVLEALRRLGVRPSRSWMVGDTPADIVAGLGAGTWTAGVTTGVHDADDLRAAGAHVVAEGVGALVFGAK